MYIIENTYNSLIIPEEKRILVRRDDYYSTKTFLKYLEQFGVKGYTISYVSQETLHKETLRVKHEREVREKAIREEQLNHPTVDKDIRSIKDLESLLAFLMDYYNTTEEDSIQEYSIDKELSEAVHEVNMKMLNNKKELYLNEL